jgi:hypothetical protein
MVIIGRSHGRSFQPASKSWPDSPARGKIPDLPLNRGLASTR